jgi:hypothetical protein
MNIISVEKIQATKTYIELGKDDLKHPGLNNKMLQQMLLKRSSREAITHQMVLWRNGRDLENILSKNQQSVLQELIDSEINQKSE